MKKTVYVFTCALCALFVLPGMAQVPAYVPADGLVGWWPFNGNANDESGNGNDGEVNGATLAEDRFGNMNNSYLFTDNTNVSCPIESSVFGTDFTISLWCKFPGYASSNSYPTILIGENYNYVLQFTNTVEPSVLQSFFGSTSPGIYDGLARAAHSIGEWAHILVLNNQGITTIKFNGVTYAVSGEPSIYQGGTFGQTIRLGGGFQLPAENFSGSLDDIAIYNRALTPEEITSLYTGEPVSPPAACNPLPTNLQDGLLGYWPFCGNANDESGIWGEGVVVGALLTEDRFGNANSAYHWNDGIPNQKYIEIGEIGDSLIGSSVSISAWFYAEGGYGPNPRIIDFGSNYAGIWSLGTDSSSRQLAGFWPPSGGYFVSNPILTGAWHHMVYSSSVESGLTELYIDGSLDTSFCCSQFDPSTAYTGNWKIGGMIPSDHWGGKLDDIAIWSRALGAADVQALFTEGACAFTVYDTITVENVIYVYDTLTIENEVIVYDTIITDIENVINVYDTNYVTIEEVVYDTIYTTTENIINIYDTTYTTIENTIDVYDTTIVNEYITVTDTLLIEITFTGVEGQPSALNTVTVFPNPASDHITIDYGNFALMAGYNTVITDAAGATVYSSAINSQQAYIDINAWGAAGVYYMTIYDAGGAAVAVRHIVLE